MLSLYKSRRVDLDFIAKRVSKLLNIPEDEIRNLKKKGNKSVGVHRQWIVQLGKVPCARIDVAHVRD